MSTQLLLDVQNLIQNIDVNFFDWTFYLTYNPELVFIGINNEDSAKQYFQQQSGQQITNQYTFFQLFQRSLVDTSSPQTKFDPLFYKSYYQIEDLVAPLDITCYWLLYGYNNNQNVLSQQTLIFYQQMDIDKIIHNTQTNTPNYLVSNILKQSNNQTQDFLNDLLQNKHTFSSSDQKQNLVIYFQQQIVDNFSSIKTSIDSIINQRLQSYFNNYQKLCDSYFQSKTNEFYQLFNSTSSQYQQLNLNKINFFQDQNFQAILNLQNLFHDLQQQLSQLNSNLQNQISSNSNTDSSQYKDFSIYIKHLQSQKKLDLQNDSIKSHYLQ